MKPAVSIITPTFNSSKYLGVTIESVISQEFEDWEHILFDDCSDDNSFDLIRSYEKQDKRFRAYSNIKNSGSGVTRNNAIKIARGKYIAFLDSDDIWHPQKLARQIEFMEKNNHVFSHTSYGYIDELGNQIKSTFHVSNKPVSYYDLLKRTEISCLTAVYNAEAIGKYYMSGHRRKQDYALWLSILKEGYKSHGIDQELAFYRQHGESATSNKISLITKHLSFLKETQGFSTIQAAYYTAYWLINGFIRYYIR